MGERCLHINNQAGVCVDCGACLDCEELRRDNARLRGQAAQLRAWLIALAEYAEHEQDCPEDDTCECVDIRRINAVLADTAALDREAPR